MALRALGLGILTLSLAGCGGNAQQVLDETPPPGAAATEEAEVERSLPDSSALQEQGAGSESTTTQAPTENATPPATEVHLAAQMSPNEVRTLLERHPEVLLLDVRQPEEWTPPLGHIEGATLIPLPELNARVGEIADYRDRPIVTVCRSGRRSEIARQALVAAGFTNVANMKGGMIEWRRTE